MYINTATVLYLCTNNYLKIQNNQDDFIFELGDEKDRYKIGRCELYVLRTIINKTKFDENVFKKMIMEDAIDKGLIENKKQNKIKKWSLIVIISIFLSIISYLINWYFFILLIIVLPLSLLGFGIVSPGYI